jgi:hypothetical protein
MKKIIVYLLTFCITAVFFACGDNDSHCLPEPRDFLLSITVKNTSTKDLTVQIFMRENAQSVSGNVKAGISAKVQGEFYVTYPSDGVVSIIFDKENNTQIINRNLETIPTIYSDYSNVKYELVITDKMLGIQEETPEQQEEILEYQETGEETPKEEGTPDDAKTGEGTE